MKLAALEIALAESQINVLVNNAGLFPPGSQDQKHGNGERGADGGVVLPIAHILSKGKPGAARGSLHSQSRPE